MRPLGMAQQGRRTQKKRSRASTPTPGKPEAFADSFGTANARFYVEVKVPKGEATEDIEVKIDCNGRIHGDENTIGVLIEMLEGARGNLIARRQSRAIRLTACERRALEHVRKHGRVDWSTFHVSTAARTIAALKRKGLINRGTVPDAWILTELGNIAYDRLGG